MLARYKYKVFHNKQKSNSNTNTLYCIIVSSIKLSTLVTLFTLEQLWKLSWPYSIISIIVSNYFLSIWK